MAVSDEYRSELYEQGRQKARAGHRRGGNLSDVKKDTFHTGMFHTQYDEERAAIETQGMQAAWDELENKK